MKFWRLIVMSALLACVLPSREATAHKFYTSLARIEHNAASRSVEVSLRIFADDLELALTRRAGKPVSLERTKDVDQLIVAYLRETFEIRNRERELKSLKWVGMELRAGVALIYVEADMPEGLAGASIRNLLLCELYAKQVNTVSVSYAGQKKDFVFVRGNGERRLPPPSRG